MEKIRRRRRSLTAPDSLQLQMRKLALKQNPIPSKAQNINQRTQYLWSRARRVGMIIGKLNKMSKDIQLYGANRNHYSTSVATDEEPDSSKKPRKKWIIYPDDQFKKYWNVVVIILLILTATIMPYRICFESQTTQEWFIIEILIDALFILDIVINFFSAYQYNKILVTNRKKIAKHYLKTWFFIDSLACVPFQLIEVEDDDSDQNYNRLVRLLRIPRLYRLLRIIRLVKMVRLFKSQTFVTKLISKLKFNRGIIRIFTFTFSVLIMVHLIGCLWYYLALLQSDILDTWLYRYDMIDQLNWKIYLYAIYWVFTTLTTVGYGDITPFTNLQKIFAIVLMGVGVGFYSYMIGNMSNIIAQFQIQHQGLKVRIGALNEFSKAASIPEELRTKIGKTIERNHTQNIYNLFNTDLLSDEIPASLKSKISDHLYNRITQKIHFFQDKYPSFLSFVVPLLKLVSFENKAYLYHQGDYPEQVYFLIKGRVHLRASNNIVFRTYVSGSYFGQIELLEKTHRNCSVQVVSKEFDCYILSKDDFLVMMEEFVEVAEEVREVAKIRQLKHQQAIRHVLELSPFGESARAQQCQDAPEEILEQVHGMDRRSSIEIKDDVFQERVKKRNRTIWANAIDYSKSPGGSYGDFLIRSQGIIKKFLKQVHVDQKEHQERITPKPVFRKRTFEDLVENTEEVDSIVFEQEEEGLEEERYEGEEEAGLDEGLEEKLFHFEDQVESNTSTIWKIKNLQISSNQLMESLINLNNKK